MAAKSQLELQKLPWRRGVNVHDRLGLLSF
jgi:hypothetical protein